MYLQSQEEYFPSDIDGHLKNTQARLRGKPKDKIPNSPATLSLDNLDVLNALGGKDIFLSSQVDFTKNPAWMKGVRPDTNGRTNGAKSCCIVVNDHGAGNVDAFYIYFYSYVSLFRLGGVCHKYFMICRLRLLPVFPNLHRSKF